MDQSEQLTQTQAQRVWQRVKGGDGPAVPSAPLPRLMALESDAGAVYTYLAKNSSLRDNRTLHQLREMGAHQQNALAGLSLLTTGACPPPPQQPNLRGNGEGLLRLAWQTRQQALILLNGMQLSPEFAFLPQKLAAQTQEQCRLILELLGQICRQKK